MTDRTAGIGQMFGSGGEAGTFLGFPACSAPDELEAEIAILGAPCASPYPSVGAYCAGAPAAIRAGIAGYSAVRDHHDFDLLAGKLNGLGGVARFQDAIATLLQNLAR